MMTRQLTTLLAGAVLAGLACSHALAVLPPPSPQQAQAAAAKKAQAEAQAQKDRELLMAAMDRIAARYRSQASAKGWKTHPAVAVTQPAALTAPARGAGPAGQPEGKLTPAAAAAPVRSEKAGTAPPSADVKKKPD